MFPSIELLRSRGGRGGLPEFSTQTIRNGLREVIFIQKTTRRVAEVYKNTHIVHFDMKILLQAFKRVQGLDHWLTGASGVALPTGLVAEVRKLFHTSSIKPWLKMAGKSCFKPPLTIVGVPSRSRGQPW